MAESDTCPLCQKRKCIKFFEDTYRLYLQCPVCHLVYVPSDYHLGPEEEKARYDKHNNCPDDVEYRKFLGKLFNPLSQVLNPGDHGLDFGCGPGPTLSLMFEQAGHPMSIYDPFYTDDPTVLDREYDFLTCTEAVEHFYQPQKEWELLIQLTRQGGYVGIMTELLKHPASFSRWHYKNDDTHVCFYSISTFHWLAEKYSLSLDFFGNSVVILKKS